MSPAISQIDFSNHPVSQYLLSGYLANCSDPVNFPTDELPGLLDRYEQVFADGLNTLGLTKEQLRSRAEFNFGSCDAANLESAIGVLRAAKALNLLGFSNVRLTKAGKSTSADLTCEKNDHQVFCEVKTITKQSAGREGFFLRRPAL